MADKIAHYLDVNKIRDFIEKGASFSTRSDDINKSIGDTVRDLLDNHWKGDGADAFKTDTENVMANISGVKEILDTMCSTLSECVQIYEQVDRANADRLPGEK